MNGTEIILCMIFGVLCAIYWEINKVTKDM
jgi:hypothetical protein